MTTIELYLFDELPEEVQKKVHEKAEYFVCPWAYELYKSWWDFVDSICPELKIRWDNYYECFSKSYYDDEMSGKRLVKALYKRLSDLPTYPTGSWVDECTFGFARQNLSRILKYDMSASDYANYVCRHIEDLVREEEDYCNSFEGYKEMAEDNEWLYTASGQMVYV